MRVAPSINTRAHRQHCHRQSHRTASTATRAPSACLYGSVDAPVLCASALEPVHWSHCPTATNRQTKTGCRCAVAIRNSLSGCLRVQPRYHAYASLCTSRALFPPLRRAALRCAVGLVLGVLCCTRTLHCAVRAPLAVAPWTLPRPAGQSAAGKRGAGRAAQRGAPLHHWTLRLLSSAK